MDPRLLELVHSTLVELLRTDSDHLPPKIQMQANDFVEDELDSVEDELDSAGVSWSVPHRPSSSAGKLDVARLVPYENVPIKLMKQLKLSYTTGN